jgi:hypothetical protein
MPKLNCQETQNLLEASHDNELDGVTSLSVQNTWTNARTVVGSGVGSARSRHRSGG